MKKNFRILPGFILALLIAFSARLIESILPIPLIEIGRASCRERV